MTETKFQRNETQIDLITVNIYSVAVPILISLCVLAVVANGLILIIARWIPSRLMKPPLKLTLSLAGADAWTSTVIAMGLLAHSYAPHVLGMRKPSWYDCASYGLEALRLGGMLTSVLHLLTLAMTQYFAAAHPHRYKAWLVGCRLRLIHGVIITLWVAPPSLFFIIFGAYSHRTFMLLSNLSLTNIHAISDEKSCNADFLDTLGVRLLVFIIVSVPIAIMTAVYIKIFFVLLALRRETSCDNNNDRSASCTQCRFRNRIRRCTKRVITTLLTVSTFLIGWIPAAALFALTCSQCLYPYKTLRTNHPSLFFALNITGNVLIISKGLVNPFIYSVRIPEIQDAINRVFRHSRDNDNAGRCSTVSVSGRRRSEGDSLIKNFNEKRDSNDGITIQTQLLSPNLYVNRTYDMNIYGSTCLTVPSAV